MILRSHFGDGYEPTRRRTIASTTKDQLTAAPLLSGLVAAFFKLLDELTIARSCKHIQKYYKQTIAQLGGGPARNKPVSIYPEIDTLGRFLSYDKLNDADAHSGPPSPRHDTASAAGAEHLHYKPSPLGDPLGITRGNSLRSFVMFLIGSSVRVSMGRNPDLASSSNDHAIRGVPSCGDVVAEAR